MHSELSVRNQLLVIVGFDVIQLRFIRCFGRVDNGLDVVFQFLHDVLVLQLLNIAVFTLHVCVEKAASLKMKNNY